MNRQLVVFKGRVTVVTASLGYDVSDDELVSEIRVNKDPESELIATWTIENLTDGTDGELVMTLDDSAGVIERSNGYTDIKRITAGKPINVFDDPLEVLFKNPVTE